MKYDTKKIMANAIQEKLRVLHLRAKENNILSTNASKILKQYIDNGKNTLDDIEDGKDFFYSHCIFECTG